MTTPAPRPGRPSLQAPSGSAQHVRTWPRLAGISPRDPLSSAGDETRLPATFAGCPPTERSPSRVRPRRRNACRPYFAALALCQTLWAWPAYTLPPDDAQAPLATASPWQGPPPNIDGRLDEAAWQGAAVSAGFVERKPKLGAAPPVHTEFRLLFDAGALYIGVFCAEPDPQAVTARTTARDAFAIFADDAISIKIDALHDERTTVGLVLNPAGARLDYRGVNESQMMREWDGVWLGAAARVAGGWSAEFRVSWTVLGIDPQRPPVRLGLNLSRDHARRNATYDWSLMPPPFSPIAASRYGHMAGLGPLQGLAAASTATGDETGASGPSRSEPKAEADRGFLAVPWALAALSQPAGAALTHRLDAGADLLLRRGGLRAQVTLNTDFAQADVDDAVVNLDRFSLQMPEKRDFFMRDVERFTFGRQGAAQALYSRKIGLDRGQRVPIAGGVKAVGEVGDAMQLSALNVVTRPHGTQPWTNHSALRGQYQLAGGSYLGAVFTQRQSLARADDANTVVGIDGALRGGRRPLLVEAFALLSRTGGAATQAVQDVGAKSGSQGGTSSAESQFGQGAGISMTWRGLLLRPSLAWLWSDADLRADLGFLRRVGVHEADASVVVEPRIGRLGLERLRLDANAGTVLRPGHADGTLLDADAAAGFDLVWNEGWQVGGEVQQLHESVLRTFDLAGEPIEIGRYTMQRWVVGLESPSVRSLSGWLDVEGRDLYGGTAMALRGGFALRPGTWLRLEGGGSAQRLRFGADERWVIVANGRAAIGISPDLNLDLYAGWDRLAGRVPMMARLRWTWRRGSDLFLVYNGTAQAGRFGHSAICKLTFAWP